MRKLPWRQRLVNWAGDRVARMIWAGRMRNEPQRDSWNYPRIFDIGGWQRLDKRPLIKPTPANLRMFGRTTYARRAMKRIKDPLANLMWEIGPKAKIELNSLLQKQIDVATFCLQHPNRDDSFRSFLEQVIEDILVNGAGCYEQQIGANQQRPLFAWPVDSLSIQINPSWSGRDSDPRYYQSRGYGNVGGVQGLPLLNSELVYIRQDPTTENPFGLGQLEIAFAAINRLLGVSDYAGKLASNAQPENLLSFGGISAEQLNTMRQWWRNEIEGQGQTPMVAPPVGAKAEVLKLRGTDDKSLFLGYQELLIREIATAFNINAMSLGVHQDVNRATAEVIDDADWDNAVVPLATLIAAYITRETIEGALGFSQLEFRFLGLKRDDKLIEAQIFKLEYEANAVVPNEYRARNNLPPMDGQWGDLTHADVEIATMAARGTGEIDDPDLPPPRKPAKPKGASKGKSKEK
jgi:hypothetical protein